MYFFAIKQLGVSAYRKVQEIELPLVLKWLLKQANLLPVLTKIIFFTINKLDRSMMFEVVLNEGKGASLLW